jgi:hypothetical protein
MEEISKEKAAFNPEDEMVHSSETSVDFYHVKIVIFKIITMIISGLLSLQQVTSDFATLLMRAIFTSMSK